MLYVMQKNIKRLLNGTESKIKQGNAKDLQKNNNIDYSRIYVLKTAVFLFYKKILKHMAFTTKQ